MWNLHQCVQKYLDVYLDVKMSLYISNPNVFEHTGGGFTPVLRHMFSSRPCKAMPLPSSGNSRHQEDSGKECTKWYQSLGTKRSGPGDRVNFELQITLPMAPAVLSAQLRYCLLFTYRFCLQRPLFGTFTSNALMWGERNVKVLKRFHWNTLCSVLHNGLLIWSLKFIPTNRPVCANTINCFQYFRIEDVLTKGQ